MSSGAEHNTEGEVKHSKVLPWHTLPASSAPAQQGAPASAPGPPPAQHPVYPNGDGHAGNRFARAPQTPQRPQRPLPATPIQRPAGVPPVIPQQEPAPQAHAGPPMPPPVAPVPVRPTPEAPAPVTPEQPEPAPRKSSDLSSFLDRFLSAKPKSDAIEPPAPEPPVAPVPPAQAAQPLSWSDLPPASAYTPQPPLPEPPQQFAPQAPVAPNPEPPAFPVSPPPAFLAPEPAQETELPMPSAAPQAEAQAPEAPMFGTPAPAPVVPPFPMPEAVPLPPPVQAPAPEAPKHYVNKEVISEGLPVVETIPQETSEPFVPPAPAEPAEPQASFIPEQSVALPGSDLEHQAPSSFDFAPTAFEEAAPFEVQQSDFLEQILDQAGEAPPMFRHVEQEGTEQEVYQAPTEPVAPVAPPPPAYEPEPPVAQVPQTEAVQTPVPEAPPVVEAPTSETPAVQAPYVTAEQPPAPPVQEIPQAEPEAYLEYAPPPSEPRNETHTPEAVQEPLVAQTPYTVQPVPAVTPEIEPVREVVPAPIIPVQEIIQEADPLPETAVQPTVIHNTGDDHPALIITDLPDGVTETAQSDAPKPVVDTKVRDRVATRLLNQGIVTKEQIREAKKTWLRSGEKDTFWRTLADHPEVNRERVYAEAASIYAFRHIEITETKPKPEFVKRVVETFTKTQRNQMFEHRLLPIEYQYSPEPGVNKLVFATHDPTNHETIRFLRELILDHFDLCYASESKIAELHETLFPPTNEYLERLQEEEIALDLGASFEFNQKQLIDEDALDAEINRSGLINLFEASLLEAVRLDASDIHIFPRSRTTQFHFRIDGELQHWHTEDKVHPEAMLAVVKDRCLNIDRFEREAAQDGFIQRNVDGTIIRYRVSVLPIASATNDVRSESVVIRVLDDRRVFTDLSAIGLLEGALERFAKAIKQPQGMVIMTGPTGSGKSTTLVAALHSVVRPQVNVLTVEDPVEYLIKDVRQIKLGNRLNLNQAIRSILRHDPDIVMVGEMRDKDTAELAIKLANTGHLTFSTLHTNDAPSAVSRLYKMGIEPFLIAYAINLVVAQRLLRKLCPECKVVDDDPDRILLRELGFTEEEQQTTTFYKAVQDETCKTCRGVGYKGRRAISEALYFSREIRHIIVDAGESIDEDAIREKAVAEGMLTLLASAREVVKMEETSVEEVIRVTASED